MRSYLNNLHYDNPIFLTILLVSIVLLVFYPSTNGGIHTIDDPGILNLYSSSPVLAQILLPNGSYYYRPVIELSFWMDNFLWGMNPIVMHLENVVLHCANSLLVFLLCRKVIGNNSKHNLLLSFSISLLFALHPVNVEPVVWIAGRTDPMYSLFVLLAFYCLLCWIETLNTKYLFYVFVLLVVSVLTKETALAACLAIVLLAFFWPSKILFSKRIKTVLIIFLAVFQLVIFSIFLNGSSVLSHLLSGAYSLFSEHFIIDGLIAIGFYLSKIIYPFPLNFAITEVNVLYGILGIIILLLQIWIYKINNKAGLLFAASTLLILPAVLVAVIKITWTPFAERYLYLSTAFCLLGIAIVLHEYVKALNEVLLAAILVTLILFFTVKSFSRISLWNDKLAFYQDAVLKSPQFGSLYHELGIIFIQHGDMDKAKDAFELADKLNKRDSIRLLIKSNIMALKYQKNDYAGCRKYFFQLFSDKHKAPDIFLELLYKSDTKRLHTLSGVEKIILAKDIFETLTILNEKKSDPFWLYKSGQMLLIVGDKSMAAEYFKRSYQQAPLDAYYRKAAEIHLNQLETNR